MLLLGKAAVAGDPVLWITYGQTRFVASPGLEFSYRFVPYIGINMGAGVYIQDPVYDQLTGIIHESSFGFYTANLGLSAYLYRSDRHVGGIIAGYRIYYGPDYRKLRYYEDGGYFIYYDGASLKPDYGPEFGIFYAYKSISVLGKFDLARGRFRVGIGYRF